MILFLGVVVGFMVVALYMPKITMIDAINGQACPDIRVPERNIPLYIGASMKQTGLWSRLNRRYRAALRERMGEHGAAMMLAILFVMVVLTTSALVMTTLLAQAIPYKNNKENSQANYAAESGLEVGLSYINETLAKLQGSTSLDDLQKVLPAVDADMNDSSKDGEFVKYDGASVLLNHVA